MSTVTTSCEITREEAEFFHDHVCGDLVVLKMQLDHLRKHTTSILHKRELRSMDNLVDQIIESVRMLSRRRLREAEIDAASLYTRIGRCVRSFEQRTRIRTHFSKTGNDNDLSKPICSAILDILKEALTNVIRHARATEVHVDAVCHQRFLALSICDNGVGAEKCAVQNPVGVGLLTMQRKIKGVGGTIDIRSPEGHGFQVFLRIPFV